MTNHSSPLSYKARVTSQQTIHLAGPQALKPIVMKMATTPNAQTPFAVLSSNMNSLPALSTILAHSIL